MKSCSKCKSNNVKQMSSFHARILLSIYVILNFYLFTGGIDHGAWIALIPLFIPYYQICADCKTEIFGLPIVNIRNFWLGNKLDKFLLAMAPSILTITLLILYFPNTGLGRIVYLPSIYLLNSMMVLLYLYKTKTLRGMKNLFSWAIIISVSVILSVGSYPQEYGDGILKKIFTIYSQ